MIIRLMEDEEAAEENCSVVAMEDTVVVVGESMVVDKSNE